MIYSQKVDGRKLFIFSYNLHFIFAFTTIEIFRIYVVQFANDKLCLDFESWLLLRSNAIFEAIVFLCWLGHRLDVFLLSLIPWIEQGVGILLVTLLYDGPPVKLNERSEYRSHTLCLLINHDFEANVIHATAVIWTCTGGLYLLGAVWPEKNRRLSIKVAQKMISQEKWYILTPLQKLPKNEGDLGKLSVA